MKHFNIIATVVTICAVLLTVLFINGEALGIEKIVDEDAESYTGSEDFTTNDLDGDWDTSSATIITLNGTDAQISGSGAYAYDGNVVISNAGDYVISGTLTDGSIIVDAYQSSKVRVMLSGADVTCTDDAAFRVNQADKVFLTLAEGTLNTLTSGETYSDDALSDNAGGAIFSHDDLTINGSGTLTVSASYKHGIDVNDTLVITGGTITVRAPADGLHVNDAVKIGGGALTIDAGDDALHCDMTVLIAGGDLLVTSCYEGIEAQQITVRDGNVTIYASDDGFNANGGTTMNLSFLPGAAAYDTETSAADETTLDPFIDISGGVVTIINETGRDADGLDSNGDIYISGGEVYVSLVNSGSNSAIDYASEAGGVCVITGGRVIACGSYGMAEHFDATSTQAAVLYNFSDGAVAGTRFVLEDASGHELMSWEVPCSFSSVNVSCPEIAVGDTVNIVIGELTEEITIASASASYGDVESAGFGGGFHQGGGMRQRGQGADGANAEAGGGMPSLPEGMTEGEMPTPPEGMTEGEMPTPPEGMTEGEMPALPEGMTEGEMPWEMMREAETAGTQTQTVQTAGGTSLSELTTGARAELIAAAALLAAGIGFACAYRRRGI